MGSQFERLETERLILRMFDENDLDEYAEMCADANVMRYLGGATMTRSEAWRSMATVLGHWQLRGFGLWAVEERTSGAGRSSRLLATRGLAGNGSRVDPAQSILGQRVRDRVSASVLDVAFSRLQLPHVISMIHAENQASIRVAQRLRMRLEGRTALLDHPVLVYGIRRVTARST